MSVKVTASGTGTLTTIAWMAPPAPPPGRSGLRNLMTPATQGIIRHLKSLFTVDVQNINRSKLHLKHSLTSPLGSFALFQRTFVPHFNPRRLAGHQPGGGQQGHNLWRLLESFLRCSEYLQGLPLWPAEDRLCVQVPRPGVLSVCVCAVSFVTNHKPEIIWNSSALINISAAWSRSFNLVRQVERLPNPWDLFYDSIW